MFPETWYAAALKGYRDHPQEYRTYSQFEYGALPPLPSASFDGSFAWLPRTHEVVPTGKSRFEKFYTALLPKLVAEAKELGCAIPDAFVRFMSSVTLPSRVRSATDCGFELAERLIHVPWEEGYLLRFYSDSQGCLNWYLWLKPESEPSVVVSHKCYGGDPTSDREFMEKALGPDWDHEDPPLKSDRIWHCAPTFEAFVYRVWLENEIWFALNDDGGALDEEQRRYLEHYRPERT